LQAVAIGTAKIRAARVQAARAWAVRALAMRARTVRSWPWEMVIMLVALEVRQVQAKRALNIVSALTSSVVDVT
jgi:hypothetical protein